MNYQIINIASIQQSMMGNAEMMQQLVQMYLVQSPIDFEALQAAIQAQDFELIRDKAHHIKPTMQYIGAMDLLQDFQLLENTAKEGKDMAEIQRQFAHIQPKFELMLEELKSLI